MAYTPIGWQDLPSEETPLSADNLNHMDEQIKANADALIPASTDNIGLVKPDGDTITVDEDGTIHSIGGGGASTWSEISNKPFESVGSGLDVSDGVLNAGEISNRINYFINTDKWTNIYQGDLNDINSNSIYNCSPSECQNVPVLIWGFVQTFVHGSGTNYKSQIYTTMNAGYPQTYTRECVDNNWSVWVQSATINQISDAYNPSKTYASGEFCIYNSTLWKSKVDNNTGNTPAEGSYWTATNVGNEINDRLGKKYSFYSIAINTEPTIIDISTLSDEIRYSRYKNVLVSFRDQNQTEAYAIGSAVANGDYWKLFCHSNKSAYFTINLICY